MKGSSATSAKATRRARPTGQRSASPPTPTSAKTPSFALTGPSDLPDPATHAYRKDLADVALAGRVIASHYAEPLERQLAETAELRSRPSEQAETIARLAAGSRFLMLDEALGWAWGYAGLDCRVGYVPSAAIAIGA